MAFGPEILLAEDIHMLYFIPSGNVLHDAFADQALL
jgi:hypothetical protein